MITQLVDIPSEKRKNDPALTGARESIFVIRFRLKGGTVCSGPPFGYSGDESPAHNLTPAGTQERTWLWVSTLFTAFSGLFSLPFWLQLGAALTAPSSSFPCRLHFVRFGGALPVGGFLGFRAAARSPTEPDKKLASDLVIRIS
jgi:hypothetical protein